MAKSAFGRIWIILFPFSNTSSAM